MVVLEKYLNMTNTQILVIVLVLVALWVYHQQNNQPKLASNSQENKVSAKQVQDLQQQVQHYQTLYQKRVAKDLEKDQTAQIQQLTLNNQELASNLEDHHQRNDLFQQKISSLESQLLNLAKQKLIGKKQAQELLGNLKSNWQQDKNLWNKTETDYSNKLTELKKDQEEKEQTIIGLNNSYDKLSEKFNQKQINLKTYLKEQEENISELEKLW